MKFKHEIYSTGFSGGKVVARAKNIVNIKSRLIDVTAKLLESLNGGMITGCDLNTNDTDMENLYKLTPHVLAAVGSDLDASSATAYGVIGAVESSVKANSSIKNMSALIHGCGAVGKVVARNLIDLGWKVHTVDIDSKRSNICGAIQIDAKSEWWKIDVDVLIPCSISGLIDKSFIDQINAKAVIPAANAPFDEHYLADKLIRRGVDVLPDPLVNAGAVIADSIELFDPKAWRNSNPETIYEFVKNCVMQNTDLFFEIRKNGYTNDEALNLISKQESKSPIGMYFSQYLK